MTLPVQSNFTLQLRSIALALTPCLIGPPLASSQVAALPVCQERTYLWYLNTLIKRLYRFLSAVPAYHQRLPLGGARL